MGSAVKCRRVLPTLQTGGIKQKVGSELARIESTVRKLHVAHRRDEGAKLQGLAELPSKRVPGTTETRLVSVLDPDDFKLIHLQKINIRCPRRSCPTMLVAVKRGPTRFLRSKPGGASCSHGVVPAIPPGGGGIESDEHLWFKGRLATICRLLGYEAVIEDPRTKADVYVPDAKTALEYQRWSTEFGTRTFARKLAGATSTIWFVPEAWSRTATKKVRSEVYSRPAALIGAYDNRRKRGEPWTSLRPWENEELNRYARLYVSGTVVNYKHEADEFFTARTDLMQFLRDVLAGTRVWIASVPVQKYGGFETAGGAWVRKTDWERHQSAERARQELWLRRQDELRRRSEALDAAPTVEPETTVDQHPALAEGAEEIEHQVASDTQVAPSQSVPPGVVRIDPVSASAAELPATETITPSLRREPWWKRLAWWRGRL